MSDTLILGDISKKLGEPFWGTDRRSHVDGVDVDIYTIVELGNAGWPRDRPPHGYSREGMQKLVDLVYQIGGKRVQRVYFFDQSIRGVTGDSGGPHYSHVHIRLKF